MSSPINPRFTGWQVYRTLADVTTMIFTVGLPVIFYLIFGAAMAYAELPFQDGNIAAYVMIGMALYGGISGAISVTGQVHLEYASGWARQLALTPLTTAQALFAQLSAVITATILPVLAVNVTGLVTGVEMPADEWVISALITVAVSVPFGFYGLAITAAWASPNAISIATTSTVILAFAANMFMPLTESLLNFARFTPLYGAAALARWPLSDGWQLLAEEPNFLQHEMWYALVNIGVWTAIFVAAWLLLRRRMTRR